MILDFALHATVSIIVAVLLTAVAALIRHAVRRWREIAVDEALERLEKIERLRQ